MNRTCGPTATNSLGRSPARGSVLVQFDSPRRLIRVWGILIGGLVLLVLSGCAPVPAVAKVGLIAPFEGLYRQSGYDALAAMRRGLAECAPAGMALIPLALDGGADPEQNRRAAAKLLLDPAVIAVVGPLDLTGAAAAADVMAAHGLPWIVPALVSPAGGYTRRPTGASMVTLAAELIQIQSPPPTRLLVAGVPAAWQPDDAPQTLDGVPVLWPDAPASLPEQVQSGDAVLWLGLPDTAVELELDEAVTLWLGPFSGGAVLAAHAPPGFSAHWLIWQAAEYNTGSSPPSLAADAASDLVYQATCAALAASQTDAAPQQPLWQLHAYRLNADGTFTP